MYEREGLRVGLRAAFEVGDGGAEGLQRRSSLAARLAFFLFFFHLVKNPLCRTGNGRKSRNDRVLDAVAILLHEV